jgi:outer membrane protein OmpA-like peptidoglycan-associated protein
MDRLKFIVVISAIACLDAGCTAEEWRQGFLPKRAAEMDARVGRVETNVREQGQRIDQIEARAKEQTPRIEQVEGRAKEQAQRIDRVEARITSVEVALTEARNQAAAGAAPTPTAPLTPSGLGERPARRSATATGPHRTLVSVVHVPFAFDRADLDDRAEMALGSIVKELRGNPKMTVDLEGTTDPVGPAGYNLRLSQRRLEAVKRWLRANGVDVSRIRHAAGRGPLLDASLKDESKRRVTVKLMTQVE